MKKEEQYELVKQQINAVLEGEKNTISIMSTISCILKETFPHFYWVGFYIEDNGVLKVGPYQGTLGCLSIAFDRGVCGRAYRLGETQIVENTHDDPEHIACDPKSNSEIVIPVRDNNNTVFAVLDVDSTEFAAFDTLDQKFLEEIIFDAFNK